MHCLLTKIGSQASGRGLFEICQILSPSLNSFQILVMTPLKIWSPPPPAGNAAVVEKPYLKIFETRKNSLLLHQFHASHIFLGLWSFHGTFCLTHFFAILLLIKIKCKKWIQNYCRLYTLSSDGYYFFAVITVFEHKRCHLSSSHCKKPSSASSASMLVLLCYFWQVEPCNYL